MAMLGFALVVQLRQVDEPSLSTMRQSDLVQLLDQTTRQVDQLEQEAADLERTRQKLVTGSDSQQAAIDAALKNVADQGILSGRLPAEGPGIELTLTEGSGTIRAATLLDVLQELRNAGAEAVQVNDVRLSTASYIAAGQDGVVVDGTTVRPPYRWVVIGDPDTIATALDIPGGALATVRNDGGAGTVARRGKVQVTATRSVPAPQHATPAPPGAP